MNYKIKGNPTVQEVYDRIVLECAMNGGMTDVVCCEPDDKVFPNNFKNGDVFRVRVDDCRSISSYWIEGDLNNNNPLLKHINDTCWTWISVYGSRKEWNFSEIYPLCMVEEGEVKGEVETIVWEDENYKLIKK